MIYSPHSIREAERQVRQRLGVFSALTMIAAANPVSERWHTIQLPACLSAAHDELADLPILPEPCAAEID